MKDLTIFKFEKTDVREITDENGNPWFVAKDVCEALEVVGYRRATQKLDDTEKDAVRIPYTLSNGAEQLQKTTIINESGVYELAFTSRSKKAKQFKKWLKNDVLPSIRKTGGYQVDGELDGKVGFFKLLDKAESLGVRGSDVLDLIDKFRGDAAPEPETTKKKTRKPATPKKEIKLTDDGWYQASELAYLAGLSIFGYGKYVNTILTNLGIHKKVYASKDPKDFKWVMGKGYEDCVKEKENVEKGYTQRWFNAKVAMIAIPAIKKQFKNKLRQLKK